MIGVTSKQNQAIEEEEDGSDLMKQATEAVDDLYRIRDTYFPSDANDKINKLQSQSQIALNLLDSVPPEERKLATQRATYEYLRGKILDVFPEYSKKAEDHLSKAVKLNPSLADAWLCLGNCIWKKGDLPATRNCFTLALSKGPNKRILSQLSMLERRMAQGADNQEELVNDSIKHAKEAIALDVKDGNSWYNLGNACLTCFFVTGAWDHSKLQQSLKAYQNAEKDESMKFNPDLYFNCATVNTYLENYERALSGFEAAASIDPCLNATEEVQKMINLFDKLDSLLKGQIKAKRLASLTSSLPEVQLKPSYKRATIDNLLDGLNKTIAVVGKVLFFIKHENITPLYYLVCDSNQTCFVLTVYGINNEAIKEGDQVTLLDPCFRNNNFSWNEKHYEFRSVRLDFLEQVQVNGKPVPPRHSVRSSIYAQHKP
ncbi:putative tetratricopeptide repeat protein 5, OB [Helianthus annuus]|uniref:Putative tetratricopeptide repeat protein 5 n=2 Tax=Helianthus annuus TaxID=4232 RepID=A0A251S7X0_HELAN|nr:tetratricopeptide repeat protein 5 isoform X1 [Helianthus annuus]KAJ0450859.1 putative tetratricopeptide repeat protein 5, OB [Helianthus annuus]KAJ0455189.1 putative tetratricopeptide repeat protein 5, OB [Helianthus annuus]KAJ0472721.1 putative tetratricopeptide repeat protein 5, OB [Helianthus annuus]KAJ0648326.1 putative tetratricopeptide repeat protein 5, OB [Helianthus annuus]KAJ0652162.1 putative tetratricopeptide repeat protein 5, OB [Helianthus annuus]